jgi:hypothetical protein
MIAMKPQYSSLQSRIGQNDDCAVNEMRSVLRAFSGMQSKQVLLQLTLITRLLASCRRYSRQTNYHSVIGT